MVDDEWVRSRIVSYTFFEFFETRVRRTVPVCWLFPNGHSTTGPALNTPEYMPGYLSTPCPPTALIKTSLFYSYSYRKGLVPFVIVYYSVDWPSWLQVTHESCYYYDLPSSDIRQKN